MTTFTVDLTTKTGSYKVIADTWAEQNGWIVFHDKPPEGGIREHWRVRREFVVAIATKKDAKP